MKSISVKGCNRSPGIRPRRPALRGVPAKQEEMWNKFYRKVLVHFCWRYLGDREQAERAVQEIFSKVLRSKDVPHDHFRAWLYRLARDHCLEVLRAQGRRHYDEEAPPGLPPGGHTSGKSPLPPAYRSRLDHLIGALPAPRREVVRLRHVEGLTRAEIAYVLEGVRYTAPARLLREGRIEKRETVRIRKVRGNMVYVEQKKKLLT